MSQSTTAATSSAQGSAAAGEWIGDRKAMVYFKATCQAARAIPDERRVSMTYEASFSDLGYRRSREPGC
jgi:hypothetical protein